MNKMIALACLSFAFTVSAQAFAAGEKMKGCSKEATGMKGEKRKAFMKKCLSKDYVLESDVAADAPAAVAATPATSAIPAISATPATSVVSSAQQDKMQDKMKMCNADAKTKGLKDDERKKFMSTCLKG